MEYHGVFDTKTSAGWSDIYQGTQYSCIGSIIFEAELGDWVGIDYNIIESGTEYVQPMLFIEALHNGLFICTAT